MTDLIERLRSVKWDVISDGDRMPDDPTRECVFVDMRPAEFEALLTEAADALEAERKDAERYRWLSAMATQQADYLGPIFRIDVRRSEPHLFNFDAAVDAAIDQARGKE